MSIPSLKLVKSFEDQDVTQCDFIIKLKTEKKVYVHRLVLLSKSALIEKLGVNGPNGQNTLVFPEEFSDKSVECCLKFLYGNELTLDEVDVETAKQLMMIGAMFKVIGLEDESSAVLMELLTKNIVLDVWQFMKINGFSRILEKLGRYVCKYFDPSSLLKDIQNPEFAIWLSKFNNKNKK